MFPLSYKDRTSRRYFVRERLVVIIDTRSRAQNPYATMIRAIGASRMRPALAASSEAPIGTSLGDADLSSVPV